MPIALSVAAMLARSPNRKAAAAYLAASGAVSLTVIVRDGVGSIHTGKISGTVAARWWLHHSQEAARVAAQARRLAGAGADVAAALDAVQRSAASLGATLTPDDTAIVRADGAMRRLDAMMHKMKVSGELHQFNRQYARHRAAAKIAGRGYMSYGCAMQRLKKALVPMLQSGERISGLFDQVFR
jgi:hypothetical protein